MSTIERFQCTDDRLTVPQIPASYSLSVGLALLGYKLNIYHSDMVVRELPTPVAVGDRGRKVMKGVLRSPTLGGQENRQMRFQGEFSQRN